MGRHISLKVEGILDRAADFEEITREEALLLLRLDLDSRETYAALETANRLSRIRFKGKGENHFHIGLNVEPCPFNCLFCSLTTKADIFKEKLEFPKADILRWAKQGEAQGADALNLMTTGTYSFERLIETGKMLKKEVSVPLVANTRDINHQEGERLLEVGFVGATYSGVMRRINFPGSPMEKHGMITERETARMAAVSRLVMGDVPRAHCTHEPNSASLMAGVNLLFPEVGSSPRDGKADTGKGRGKSLASCREMFKEMGWNPNLPSNCFAMHEPYSRSKTSKI